MQYIYPSPFAGASLHLIACKLCGKPACDAEPRIELGPALQQADAQHAAPTTELPAGPKLSNSAPNWATPHNQLSHAAPQLSYASPKIVRVPQHRFLKLPNVV